MPAQPEQNITDRGDWVSADPPAFRFDEFRRTSSYITLGDGCRLASDLYLPVTDDPSARFPALLILTPYFRGLELIGEGPFPPAIDKLQYDSGMWGPDLSRHGYAVLVVEMRGAAASFGQRTVGPARRDGRDDVDLVDWIVAQPWSNGRVGATGISAPGMAALGLLTAKHPAVRAVAPLWTAHDMYACTHPGGAMIEAFVQANEDGVRLIDTDRLAETMATTSPEIARHVRGIRRVDEDQDGSLLAAALHEHEGNAYLQSDIIKSTFRDDALPQAAEGANFEDLSPGMSLADLEASEAAIYSYAGWFDGAFINELVHLHNSVSNAGGRLIIGPWGHGGHFYDSPWATTGRLTDFDHAGELARFFDQHLRDDVPVDRSADPVVRYFTMGAEQWRSAPSWPVPARDWTLYLDAAGRLSVDAPEADVDARDHYDVDFEVGTGLVSRYTNSGVPVAYPDRSTVDDRLLVFQSDPVDRDIEVTGHTQLHLHVSADAPDFLVVAYLEDVAPDGTIRVVTEGVQRALFRAVSTSEPPYEVIGPYRSYVRAEAQEVVPGEVFELRFDLYPVSWLLRRGHSLRLAFAGADANNFTRVPETGTPRVTFHRSSIAPSRIVLPVVD